jgi:predicted transcriptional regulator
MKVSELMHTDVHAVRRDATSGAVVEALADAHITGVPVVDRHNKIIGVISTTDLLAAQAERLEGGEAWEDRLVEDVMSRPALTIAGDADIREAAQRMLYAEVHRLFVEKNGELAGVISQTDLVRALATHQIAG